MGGDVEVISPAEADDGLLDNPTVEPEDRIEQQRGRLQRGFVAVF